MSKLNVDQKTIRDLLQDKRADFLIPDYQRPYAWGEKECQTLWDDIFSFAIPDDGKTDFDSNSEYFLGPIVTFVNENGKKEIIDGQQRLTTIMLLLRAFYAKFGHMMDKASVSTKQNIEKCLWKTDEFGEADMAALKIDSEVATDNDKDEFLTILKTGNATGMKSRYAQNYGFFQKCIQDFLDKFPTYFAYLPTRIMNNCILLPIEAESQDTALSIFSPLNDRGKPLSAADIFKAQFYKYYSKRNEKNQFIQRWKELEELCGSIFHPISGTPMDELFTRYMYYVRAKKGIKSSTTEALRKFYEQDSYAILKQENTFDDLVTLANFWNDVLKQDDERFSQRVLRRLLVLYYAPNGMWTYFVSVYFMHNKDANGLLDDEAFFNFLHKITAFIWAYAVVRPGVNALRTPVYAEMINIVNDNPVTFDEFRFDYSNLYNQFINFGFYNARPITKSMLAWWAYRDENQQLLPLATMFDIEHIYPKARQEKESSLTSPKNIEALGNKALLEQRINIRASDYRFADKKKYYLGYTNSHGQTKEGTKNRELIGFAEQATDFTEEYIVARTEMIIRSFVEYLREKALLAPSQGEVTKEMIKALTNDPAKVAKIEELWPNC